MGERAIFQGTFADFKIIKGRKQAQFVIEVPIEAADAALKALGGVPRADSEVWVAVARLDPKAAQAASPAPEEPKFSLTRQSAIACGDPRFWGFLTDRHLTPDSDPIAKAEDAAEMVREICEVQSRAEFDTDPEAGKRWQKLYTEYQAEDRI